MPGLCFNRATSYSPPTRAGSTNKRTGCTCRCARKAFVLQGLTSCSGWERWDPCATPSPELFTVALAVTPRVDLVVYRAEFFELRLCPVGDLSYSCINAVRTIGAFKNDIACC